MHNLGDVPRLDGLVTFSRPLIPSAPRIKEEDASKKEGTATRVRGLSDGGANNGCTRKVKQWLNPRLDPYAGEGGALREWGGGE